MHLTARTITDIAPHARVREPRARRLLPCAATLVCACFNPGGGGDGASTPVETGTAAATASTDVPSTAPTSSGDPPPTTSNTGGMTTTVDPTTSGPTSADETTGGTTTLTTVTSLSTVTDTTTVPLDCSDNPCPQCKTCVAGTCMPTDVGMPCTPEPGACTAKIGALVAGKCYTGAPSAATCNANGVCAYGCDNQGALIVGCDSELCLNPRHPCIVGDPVGNVTKTNLCVIGGTTDNCRPRCDEANLSTVTYYCDTKADCVGGLVSSCEPYQCEDPPGACKLDCLDGQGCYPNHMCTQGMCS